MPQPVSLKGDLSVHGKDARIGRRLADVGGLEYQPVTQTKNPHLELRGGWLWTGFEVVEEFFSVLRMTGYNGYVSLEMEDLTMTLKRGLRTSNDALNATLSQ